MFRRIRATLSLGILITGSATVGLGAAGASSGGISSLPTPWVIAHRGGPLVWPEATMEAYEASTKAGNQFVEVDCLILADGQGIGLMHDNTLTRATNSDRIARELTSTEWGALKISGRKLLGPKWGEYHAPFLDEVIMRFRNERILFIEPKDGRAGTSAVEKLKLYHVGTDYAVINSVQESDLRPAIKAGYRTCLNLANMKRTPKSIKQAGYWAVCCPQKVSQQYITELKEAGLKVIAPPINRHFERDRFLKWGVDGFYTDDPVYQSPGAARRDTDPYQDQKFGPGMLAALGDDRGYFAPPNKWGINASEADAYRGCLQGWMCPVGGAPEATSWSMELSITFGARLEPGRWAGVAVFKTDAPLGNDSAPQASLEGYNLLFHNNGELSIYRYDGVVQGAPLRIANVQGPKIADNETVRYRVTITPEQIKLERTDGKASVFADDKLYRGAYVTFGAKGQRAEFSQVRVSSTPSSEHKL